MPEVGIGESIGENLLIKIVTKQARLLLDEMDATEEVAPKKDPTRFLNPIIPLHVRQARFDQQT